MSIFLNKDSRIIVQGMTGAEGMKHTRRMLASGSNIVGGVNPKKAGERVDIDGQQIPVFGSVREAMQATDANVTVTFVPAKFTKDAAEEAIRAGIELVVIITEEFQSRTPRSSSRLRASRRPASLAPTVQVFIALASPTQASSQRRLLRTRARLV